MCHVLTAYLEHNIDIGLDTRGCGIFGCYMFISVEASYSWTNKHITSLWAQHLWTIDRTARQYRLSSFSNYSGRRARKHRWLNVQCMDGGEKLEGHIALWRLDRSLWVVIAS
jgi:hypothetical protein